MASSKSPDTRPTDLETPADVDTSDTPVAASTNSSTDADILREQAISDSHARDDLQAKQDTKEERLTTATEDTSSDIKQGAAIRIPGEL
ncbi:MAG: hypothetical protein AB1589_17795 [Cyanobacteriota bacterium]